MLAAITKHKAVRIVEALAAAKSRQNVDDTMSIYHPNGVLESPSLSTHSVGPQVRDAIIGWFAFAPDYNVDLDGYGLDGGVLCCWGTASSTPAFTFSGAIPNGERATVPVFILFGFDDGQVSWESFHLDIAAMARQVGVQASDLVHTA